MLATASIMAELTTSYVFYISFFLFVRNVKTLRIVHISLKILFIYIIFKRVSFLYPNKREIMKKEKEKRILFERI